MSDKYKMLRRIYAFDFAIWELTLYMDSHPDDIKALKTLEQYRAKRAELVCDYEARFGPYILTSDDVRGDRWTWIDSPWPWDMKEDC